MIYTLTLNPSLDYIIQLDSLEEGKVNLAKSEYKLPGGKGINVSQVLKNLDHNSVALGFLGGFTGDFIKNKLLNRGIKCDFVKVDGDTRINVKMKRGEIETEINGNSPSITVENKNELMGKLKKLNNNDILVLSGSVPHSLGTKIYKEIMNVLPEGLKVMLDTKEAALETALSERPYVIKPNHHELEELFGIKLKNLEEISIYGKKLKEMGAQNVIVSMAGKGAILITDYSVYFANVPKGEVKNSVGAGDSVVGGFTSATAEGLDIIQCFKRGIAAGSASAFSENLCTHKEVERLMRQITIEKIN